MILEELVGVLAGLCSTRLDVDVKQNPIHRTF